MSTSIFTFTHKSFTPPNDPTYIPLQVGAAENPPLGYLTDATGDNISELNKYYGELTGMYWIWKNYKESDYIGMCHYRRFFVNASHQLLTSEEVESLLQQYDLIVSDQKKTNTTNYFDDFAEAHGSHILEATEDAIQVVYPEYLNTFNTVFSENTLHYGNLIIMPHALFNQYAEWLFTIFQELTPLLDVQFQDLYHQRIFGFISENMISVWARYHQLSMYECPIGITSEKAETIEFKLAMSQLFKTGQLETASQMFYEYLNLRPDIRLPFSDVFGEIPIIEQLIYICNEEKNVGLSTTLDYSSDLKELIQLHRNVKNALQSDSSEFLTNNHISPIMIEVIQRNS